MENKDITYAEYVTLIKSHDIKEPCLVCNGVMDFVELWLTIPHKLLLGCQKCDSLFIFDTSLGIIQKQLYSFTTLKSLQNKKPHPKFECRFFNKCDKALMEYYGWPGICAGNAIFNGVTQNFPDGTMCLTYKKYLKQGRKNTNQ